MSKHRLDQAIELLRSKPGSIEALGPDYVLRARAAAVFADGVRNGAVLSTPVRFHDAVPRIAPRTIDQSTEPLTGGRRMYVYILVGDDNGDLIASGEGGNNVAQAASGRAGAAPE
jgi:hypothetical protein